MDYDFVRVFIPNLRYKNDKFIDRYVQNINKNDFILSKRDFVRRYPDFNVNVYYIFNDDLKIFNKIEILNHWHTFGKNEDRIYNLKCFFQRYDDYNKDFFIILIKN